MPELIEIEYYRRLAEVALGRPVSSVSTPDPDYVKKGLGAKQLTTRFGAQRFSGATRHGKVLVLESEVGDLALRFGMTGRLIVDGEAAIEVLEYSSDRNLEEWDRFVVDFADGGSLRMRDPRRLGSVELDPDLSVLGLDARRVTPKRLTPILAASQRPLKARLLDQAAVAGLGNLLVDEILWRAGLAPTRAASSLVDAERERLSSTIRRTVTQLMARGGSNTGDHFVARQPGALCPLDATPMQRDAVGGRTTWWCPGHQH